MFTYTYNSIRSKRSCIKRCVFLDYPYTYVYVHSLRLFTTVYAAKNIAVVLWITHSFRLFTTVFAEKNLHKTVRFYGLPCIYIHSLRFLNSIRSKSSCIKRCGFLDHPVHSLRAFLDYPSMCKYYIDYVFFTTEYAAKDLIYIL